MRLFIVSGLSGSGKSVTLHMLEDLDYYCVDNIPTRILPILLDELTDSEDPKYRRVAVGLDTRPRPEDLDQFPDLLRELRRSGILCEVLFLQADTEVLLERYSETRRKHPMSGDSRSLRDAIAYERELLAPVADVADLVLDTSRMSVHDLREMVRDRLDGRPDSQLSLQFQSFGYKHGLPGDADFVFDARSLPNPYWVSPLRNLTGTDQAVVEFLEQSESVQRFIRDLCVLLEHWIPEIAASNRSYLTVAVGCTGGRHRSVYIATRLAEHFRRTYPQVLLRHAELAD